MEAQLKSYMTAGVAIVGAGIIAVTPIAPLPPDTMVRAAPPTVSLDIETASVVEDLLANIALVGATGGMAADVVLSGLGAVPRYLATAVAAGLADPGTIPSLLSALVNLAFAPPGVTGVPTSMIQQLTGPLTAFTSLLPEPLRDLAFEVSGAINELIASVLGILPNPAAGWAAISTTELPEIIGSITGGIEALAEGLGESVSNTLRALGGVPALLAATFQAVIEEPSDIPGLLVNLAYSVFSPEYVSPFGAALLPGLVDPLVNALAGLPIIGGFIDGARDAFFGAVTTLLGLLPDPVSPFPVGVGPGEEAALMAAAADLGGISPAAFLPGVDGFEGVITAVRTAVTNFAAGIGDVPELLGDAVRAVIANPLDLGRQLVTFVNYAIDAARDGFQPVIAAVLGLLPEALRTPLEQIGRTVDGAIIGAQDAAQDFVDRPIGGGVGDDEDEDQGTGNGDGGNGDTTPEPDPTEPVGPEAKPDNVTTVTIPSDDATVTVDLDLGEKITTPVAEVEITKVDVSEKLKIDDADTEKSVTLNDVRSNAPGESSTSVSSESSDSDASSSLKVESDASVDSDAGDGSDDSDSGGSDSDE